MSVPCPLLPGPARLTQLAASSTGMVSEGCKALGNVRKTLQLLLLFSKICKPSRLLEHGTGGPGQPALPPRSLAAMEPAQGTAPASLQATSRPSLPSLLSHRLVLALARGLMST